MRIRHSLGTLALLAAAAACAPGEQPTAGGAAAPDAGAAALHDLFEREWESRLRNDPLFATRVGRHEYDHLMPSAARADLEVEIEETRGFLAELDAIAPDALSVSDRISFLIFRNQLEDRIADFEFGSYQVPFNADSGFHIGLARLPDNVPLRTAEDYRRYVSRLDAVGAYVDQHIANMREGIERGMVLPRAVLGGFEGTMSAHVVAAPNESLFYEPFAEIPATVPEADREALRREGRRAVMEVVVPAYERLLRFFTEEYLPNARETLGASELPDGERYYAYQVKHFTTLDLTPREIHEIGLAEVARIQEEMRAIIDEVGFRGSFADFLELLRTDPRFYASTPEELLKEASYIAKKMDGQLPRFFKTLPRLPYGVEPVPDHMAPKYTGGRYVGAPEGGTRAGTYWVNTYKLDSRPLYTLESLTLHEAVPGHHLQNALANELDGLPDFRRYSYISAFGEGWGLYSEWLGIEAGFYTDPYRDFGRLTYEMWRAARLVVDTGVHSMGWSRQQVIDYLKDHTALSVHECTTETDRYISWPGQALAYKIGELEIRKLRRRAEAALGERFDIREFHDAVLLNGAVPLPVLGEEIDRFIARTLDAAEPAPSVDLG
jgi:uncharacterized protein (DUF885 family)